MAVTGMAQSPDAASKEASPASVRISADAGLPRHGQFREATISMCAYTGTLVLYTVTALSLPPSITGRFYPVHAQASQHDGCGHTAGRWRVCEQRTRACISTIATARVRPSLSASGRTLYGGPPRGIWRTRRRSSAYSSPPAACWPSSCCWSAPRACTRASRTASAATSALRLGMLKPLFNQMAHRLQMAANSGTLGRASELYI